LLGNVGEAIAREELNPEIAYGLPPTSSAPSPPCVVESYLVPDGKKVTEIALRAWDMWPNNRPAISAISWALCALYRARAISFGARNDSVRVDIVSKLSRCEHSAGTLRVLSDLIAAGPDQAENHLRTESLSSGVPHKEQSIIASLCNNGNNSQVIQAGSGLKHLSVSTGNPSLVSIAKDIRRRGRARKCGSNGRRSSTAELSPRLNRRVSGDETMTPPHGKLGRKHRGSVVSPRGIQDVTAEG
jgi:hypothetical protein